MPNNTSDPITKSDIDEFIQSKSDFGFEIKVKQAISKLGIIPRHGGTYTDPVTQKTREYDFQFTYTRNHVHLHAAVECKNISEYSPVLVSCLPRSEFESHLRIFLSNKNKNVLFTAQRNKHYRLRGLFHPIDDNKPLRCQIGEPCGKSVNQVTKQKNGKLSGGDSDIFDTWSQAISSIFTYSQEYRGITAPDQQNEFHLFMPFVVVPNDRLWFIAYDDHGKIIESLKKTENISIYINKLYKSSNPENLPELKISHIEFMTLNGFENFIQQINKEQSGLNDLCRQELLAQTFP